MPDLSHSVVSPTSFRAEYRRTGSSSVFTRNIRLQVDVAPVRKDEEEGVEETQLHCLTFTLLSGMYHLMHHLAYLWFTILTFWVTNWAANLLTTWLNTLACHLTYYLAWFLVPFGYRLAYHLIYELAYYFVYHLVDL